MFSEHRSSKAVCAEEQTVLTYELKKKSYQMEDPARTESLWSSSKDSLSAFGLILEAIVLVKRNSNEVGRVVEEYVTKRIWKAMWVCAGARETGPGESGPGAVFLCLLIIDSEHGEEEPGVEAEFYH